MALTWLKTTNEDANMNSNFSLVLLRQIVIFEEFYLKNISNGWTIIKFYFTHPKYFEHVSEETIVSSVSTFVIFLLALFTIAWVSSIDIQRKLSRLHVIIAACTVVNLSRNFGRIWRHLKEIETNMTVKYNIIYMFIYVYT